MASEIRVNKINSRTGVGTITLSPTGVDFTGIATVATLKATAGIVTTLTTTGNATVGGTLGVTGETTFTTHINFGDNAKAIFGNGSDLQIYHDTSGAGNSIVKEEGTGELRLGSNNAVRITKHDSETCALFTIDGAAELYYDNTKKFETKSDGVDITGELQCDTLDVDGNIDLDGSKITFDSGGNVLKWADNVAAYFGDGNDLRIYHDSSNSWITDNGTGSLKIRSTAGSVQILGTTSNDNMAVFTVDGASELYHDNSKKLETTTSGVAIHEDTNKVVRFTGSIGEIGNVTGFQASNTAGDSLTDFGIRATTLRFATAGAERVRIHSGGTLSVPTGIELGSGLDGTSANTLDDYEEGTFSPTYTSGLTGDTYSNTGGHYTKIGNFVTFTIRIAGAGTNSGSEQVKIGNLPFTSSSSAREGGAWFNYRHDLDTGGAPFMHISQGDDDIKWYNSSGSSWVGSDGSGLNNKTFHVQGFYYSDS